MSLYNHNNIRVHFDESSIHTQHRKIITPLSTFVKRAVVVKRGHRNVIQTDIASGPLQANYTNVNEQVKTQLFPLLSIQRLCMSERFEV